MHCLCAPAWRACCSCMLTVCTFTSATAHPATQQAKPFFYLLPSFVRPVEPYLLATSEAPPLSSFTLARRKGVMSAPETPANLEAPAASKKTTHPRGPEARPIVAATRSAHRFTALHRSLNPLSHVTLERAGVPVSYKLSSDPAYCAISRARFVASSTTRPSASCSAGTGTATRTPLPTPSLLDAAETGSAQGQRLAW